ncbi:MAG: alpha/beta hydrolase [Deltaproteobacteria bacterium]|nr:alpha/beta hydrolase [Deltaproteobacteria bacterium]
MYKEEKLFYNSKDGTKLCGIFLIPEHIKGFVLLAHGINVNKNEYDNFFTNIAMELYKKGFASLRFDFRGHGESGGTQRDMTIIGENIDVASSVEQISNRWAGDISIIGMSFGAGPTLMYSAQNMSNINCLVLLCPVLDYVSTFLKPIVPWAKDSFNKKGFEHLKKEGFLMLDGEFELGANLIEEFKVIKPYEILKETKLPVLTIHGDNDSMVPFKVSRTYSEPNKKSEFMTIQNSDHGFIDIDDEVGNSNRTIQNKKVVIEAVVTWIEKWCKS